MKSLSLPVLDIDPFCEEFLTDPFKHFGSLRDSGPVFWLDAIGAYGVARHDEVTHVLSNHDVFVSGRGVGLTDFKYEPPFRPPSLLLEAERLVRSFLSAGVDTTVNGISNLMYAFTVFPDEWPKVEPNQQSTRRAFNEGLRWRSTVQTFFRTTSRETHIGDVAIPEGSKIVTFLAAANRDERRWENADTFDITRNASGHVAFGHGIHACLGQMVARMEADVLLTAMSERIARISANGAPIHRLNNTLCSMASVPITIEAR